MRVEGFYHLIIVVQERLKVQTELSRQEIETPTRDGGEASRGNEIISHIVWS
jgi:hypothetical protein